MKLRGPYVFLTLIISLSVFFAGGVLGAEKYKALKDDSEVSNYKNYLPSYEGMIEGKAYNVDLDWIWLDPEGAFQKYKGLTIFWEDRFPETGYASIIAYVCETDSSLRGQFRGEVVRAATQELMEAKPEKYLKKGNLMLKGCLVNYNVGNAPFYGPYETPSLEIALIDLDTGKVVGKIAHKKYHKIYLQHRSNMTGWRDLERIHDIVGSVAQLISRNWTRPSGIGPRLEEYDNLLKELQKPKTPGKIN